MRLIRITQGHCTQMFSFQALATAPIVSVEALDLDLDEYESGTAEKWVAMLEGGQKAMIKLTW